MSGAPAPCDPSPPATAVQADYGPHEPAHQTPLSPSAASRRFLYFAYGSNLAPSILRLKEVHVHSARSGYLQDVRLLFDLKVNSIVEPCYANLQRKAGERVHGVVYELDERDMVTMDRLEGNGRSYVRELFEVTLYPAAATSTAAAGGSAIAAQSGSSQSGEKVSAWAYICHPQNLSNLVLCDHPPSERYLQVLLHGARHHQLDRAYVDWLAAHPVTPLPQLKFSAEQVAALESKTITEEDMAAHRWKEYMDSEPDWTKWPDPLYMSLKGVVFDIRPSMYSSAWKKANAGKCVTLWCAGRVAINAHDIPSKLEDLLPEHKAYIDATLVDYARLYPIMGHTHDRAKFNW